MDIVVSENLSILGGVENQSRSVGNEKLRLKGHKQVAIVGTQVNLVKK